MIHTGIESINTVSASSDLLDPLAAAAELIKQLGDSDPLYAVFVTADYPRVELAAALSEAWGERLIGCTSAGNVGPAGFESAPVLAIAFQGGDLLVETVVIEPLSDLDAAVERAGPALARLRDAEGGRESFGLLLVDGVSMQEEHLVAALKPLLGHIPLVGGSAGDDLTFTETGVLFDGEFSSDRATVTIVSTWAPFQVFRIQHYEPGEEVLVITAASPAERLVHEINGMPAADAFAAAIGVPAAELGPDHFSSHPVVLRAAGENWVRCIFRALPDGSLHFLAAIDTGAVLRVARPIDAELTLRRRLAEISDELGGITSILACDCVLRRVEFGRAGLQDAIGEVMAEYRTSGFSTYGEQFDDFHMNQTMVGVAFGGPSVTGG
jgi:hypothetical protein